MCSNVNGEEGPKGRGNAAPHTMNLPRLALKVMNIENKDERIKKFFESLEDMLEKCKDTLLYRYDVLKKLKVNDLPFVAGQGIMKGSENLSMNDSIEPILKQCTWGIGWLGLAETLVALTGKHHGESEESQELGVSIISKIRQMTDEYTKKYQLNFSTYASPAESVAYKLLLKDRAKFGIIKGVTDKEYYTNSSHVPVSYPISIKDKLQTEAPYQPLCNAGCISYIEMDDYPDAEEIEKILNHAFTKTDMHYIGINFHIRYCKKCGTSLSAGHYECPCCGSDEIQGISRITGYLSLDERFGPGKSKEREDRISHRTFKNNYNVNVTEKSELYNV